MNATSRKMPYMIWGIITVLAMGLLYACDSSECSEEYRGGTSNLLYACSDFGSGDSTPTPISINAEDITYEKIVRGTADTIKPISSKLTDFSGLAFSMAPISPYVGTGTHERPTIAEDGTITTTATTTAGSYRVTITPDGSTYAGAPLTVDFYVTIKAADLADLDTKLQTAITNYGLTGDFNYIDTSAVTDMTNLFAARVTINGVRGEDRNVKNFNGDISKWDVSSVENFRHMFRDTEAFNQDIGDWDVSKGTNFNNMFAGATAFNQDIGDWDVSAGKDFGYMFLGATAFNQDIGGWIVSSGTSFHYMFDRATVFNQDIGKWNVSSGLDFRSMFVDAVAFNQDIGKWNVSSGLDFGEMFSRATAFNQDIGDWDVSSCGTFTRMFYFAEAFNQDVSRWTVSAGASFAWMFKGATVFNQDLSSWSVSPTASTTGMFTDSGVVNPESYLWYP